MVTLVLFLIYLNSAQYLFTKFLLPKEFKNYCSLSDRLILILQVFFARFSFVLQEHGASPLPYIRGTGGRDLSDKFAILQRGTAVSCVRSRPLMRMHMPRVIRQIQVE